MEEIITEKLLQEAANEGKSSSRRSSARSTTGKGSTTPSGQVSSRKGSATAPTVPEGMSPSIPVEGEILPGEEALPGEDGLDSLGLPTVREMNESELPVETKRELDALQKDLQKIRVELPKAPSIPEEVYEARDFPKSYAENSVREKHVLTYAENFRRQYTHLYRDRKPLFLNPTNELGVEKFVCTTLQPTKLSFIELYEWKNAAEFVSDYLNFVPLDPPFLLPRRMCAPMTVLRRQRGHVFECASVLASLLIGVGYDAYVVSGYATREACMADETREDCPLLISAEAARAQATKTPMKKYTVRPAKDLNSKYERKLEQRRLNAEAEARENRKKADALAELEAERPPPDPLFGQRVHAWVLVLPGRREVPAPFFVDALTGASHSVADGRFLGVESLWNHKNYWVNMQDCSRGCQNLKFDLGDATLWEYMFPSNEKPELLLPKDNGHGNGLADDDLDETKAEDVERHMDLPPSWSLPINLTPREYELRCPLGKKNKLYRKAKLEKFAPYLLRDGLTLRLSVFADRDMREIRYSKEYFKNRADKLVERVHNYESGEITELFGPGRARHIKEHTWKAVAPGPQSDRTLTFYCNARFDGLEKRVESPFETTETFVGRADRLYYRQVVFGRRTKKFGPADDQTAQLRPILRILERFKRRDSNAPGSAELGAEHEKLPVWSASEESEAEVAERIFNLAEEKIMLRYHVAGGRITSATREFLKQTAAAGSTATTADRRNQNIFSPEAHTSFQVDPLKDPKKNLELYYMFVRLLQAEQETITHVRETEDETVVMLTERAAEEAACDLDISVYDTERNEKAKAHRRELELRAEEERRRRAESEQDYLAPFLAQQGLGLPDQAAAAAGAKGSTGFAPNAPLAQSGLVTRAQAFKLREDALADLKARLIEQANAIQARFERETGELQRKEAWYQEHQVSLSRAEEEEYLHFCRDSMFRIHILEQRLRRHKEMAPLRYLSLESKLRSDVRLSEHLGTQ